MREVPIISLDDIDRYIQINEQAGWDDVARIVRAEYPMVAKAILNYLRWEDESDDHEAHTQATRKL